MKSLQTKIAEGALAALLGVSLVLGLAAVAPTTASAQTNAQLQAQIQVLLQQIAALQVQIANLGGGATANYTFTRDLTIGSTGEDVRQLQIRLNAEPGLQVAFTGVGSPGQETSFYGPLTANAVTKYQEKYAASILLPLGLMRGSGYFGPSTRAHMNANPINPPSSGDGDGDGDSGDNGELKGGAGSVSEYKKSSKWNNEEVGEDDTDVRILGLEIKADKNSDLKILALKLDFDDEGSANGSADLDKYLDDVSIWFNGKKVGSIDASEFEDDNNYGKTITLNKDVIVRSGERITIEIAASGISNLDSSDAGDSWNVDVESVRWEDAQGTVISEDPSIAETKFTVETFATATDVEFKIKGNDRDDINDAHIIDVDASNATDNVDVFSFDVEIKGRSDVHLDDLTVEATTARSGSTIFLDDMADQAHLYMDGKKVDSITVPTDENTVTFDDLDLDLKPGKTYEFVVALDFLSTSGALNEGDTVSFTIGETETDLGRAFTDIRDKNGDQLPDSKKTGSASSDALATHDVFIDLTLIGKPTIQVLSDGNGGNDDDRVTMTIEFVITARGGTVYVGDTAAATTSATVGSGATTDAIIYQVLDSGTATTDDLTTDVSISYSDPLVTDSGDNIKIQEGGKSRVKLTVTQINDSPEDDGIYRMKLMGIAWGVADDTTYEYMYSYNLDDFETPSAFAD